MTEKRFKVTVPPGNGYSNPAMMRRVVDHIDQMGLCAEFLSTDGIPTKDKDGAYTFVTRNDHAAHFGGFILRQHYGLDVAEVQEYNRT